VASLPLLEKAAFGSLEAAHENGKLGFGVDSCQDYLYPEIVASATKRVDVAVYKMISDAIAGKFEPGLHSGGLAEKWTGCSRLPDGYPNHKTCNGNHDSQGL
jgi:basic membrane lipoprotein Med (substrate-binding protein (PBP1-ABC) superfamily)